ncbi:PH and SEC7 domain-containing protein 1-like [Heterodontus francisci]|uniref:PH and SEC7 domain-containing protein 1-like n=1 Tax=Heterodontus francisci TaxID=7792 RepID=UPI00355C35E9
MDNSELPSPTDQPASLIDSDSTGGGGHVEDSTGSGAQGNIFSVDISGFLGFFGAETQAGGDFFEPNSLQVSASPGASGAEPDHSPHAGDADGERNDDNHSADWTFRLENNSTPGRSESPDSEPIWTSELPSSQFCETPEHNAGGSRQSGSISSLESDDCTPWVQAVLLTNRGKETENLGNAGESTERLLNNSDWMLTESPSTSEPLTPSVSEETNEELLKGISGGSVRVPDAATSPDEVIMDPADAVYLQSDVWHQNQAFVPISAAESPPAECEAPADETGPDSAAVPMDCEPPSNAVADHGGGEALAGSHDGSSTLDLASSLPSYFASVHKELVVWTNEPTEMEDTICLDFGNQLSSKGQEALSSFCIPGSALAPATPQDARDMPASGEILFPASQDLLVREILGEWACQDQGVGASDSGPARNSESAEALLCGGLETSQPPLVASREMWSTSTESHPASPSAKEHEAAECMSTGKTDPTSWDSDDSDESTGGLQLNESPEKQEEAETGATADARAENDVAQGESQPGGGAETGVAGATTALKVLLANGSTPDREVAKSLASKLYNLDGFTRTCVAPYLGKNTEFSQIMAEEYLHLFDFSEMALDQALRKFLKAFVLTGETQERERVLNHFSTRYKQCNPHILHSRDAVHTITCAIMLLNTDLHGQNLGKSMSSQDFITNLEGMNDGNDFPKDMLKALYHSIKSKKMEWAIDEEELQKSLVPKGDDCGNVTRVTDKGSPFLEVPQDHKAATYKQGFLSRKVHADTDGKKRPWGKRSWKTFYAVLKGTIIYLLKDEYRPNKQSSEEAISIHHSLATKAAEYNKRPHVFRLKTADWRIFLFQAQTADQMNSWITRINLVAAMFSSPPFPAAIGSKRKFSRPILPSATSKQSEKAQLESHDSMLQSILDDLEDHQMNAPDKKGKAKEFEEYKLKQEYFEYEKCRIETYVKLLKLRLNEGTDDLDKLEAQLFDTIEEKSSTLKKSHSSPSLNLEQAPVVKVKRNVSERRTYRKIIPNRHRKLL